MNAPSDIARRMKYAYLIVAVIAALAVLVIAALATAARCRLALAGVWVGDGAWLADAGLESAQLFLAPRPARGARRGYLVMVSTDGSLIANGAVDVDVGDCPGSMLVGAVTARPVTTAVSVRPAAGAAAPPLPAAMRASLSPDGVLTVVDVRKKTLYARLFRDPLASADALMAFAGK